jgi:hypothetical protein
MSFEKKTRVLIGILLALFIGVIGFLALERPSPPLSLAPLLPGQQRWKNGVSSYLFGTNNTNNWEGNNLETNATAQQLLQEAHLPLIRTWFFSPYGYASHLGTDAETDKRLQVDETIGAQCLGVLQDAHPRSAQYYQHLIQYVGNRCLIYEFGNEPGATGEEGMLQYIRDWNSVIPQLRKSNPQAKFGGPVNDVGDIPIFLSATQRSGVLPDFVSFHEYNHDPTVYGIEITQAKEIVQHILGYQIPVGLTEWNYDCCHPFDADDATFEQQYFTAAYTGLIAAYADFATEFDTFNHGGTSPLDMFDSTGQPRGVYTVMKQLISHYSNGVSLNSLAAVA